jgi:HAD superfamily hydrolase (TIGR01509 family)
MKDLNFEAAIFDMDGLLLDTERVCMKIFSQACETLQVPFKKDIYLSIIGCNAASIEKIFRAGYGDDFDYPAVNREWRERYQNVVMHEAIPVKEGVVQLLNWLKGNDIPIAVATSTQRNVAERKLELAGLNHYFDHISTGCEVEQGKPHPEIYLLAAKRLNIAPDKCLAFEDSNNGVRSAVAANTITYQIPDLVEPCQEVLALGHKVRSSLNSVYQELA